MNSNMNSAMKTVGVSLAVGTAAAGMSTPPLSSSRKRKMKKAAKKAANTINTIVDNMQDMIK